MSKATPQLGTCPFCGATVRQSALLIEYEVAGETRLFAECGECEEPVQPQ